MGQENKLTKEQVESIIKMCIENNMDIEITHKEICVDAQHALNEIVMDIKIEK